MTALTNRIRYLRRQSPRLLQETLLGKPVVCRKNSLPTASDKFLIKGRKRRGIGQLSLAQAMNRIVGPADRAIRMAAFGTGPGNATALQADQPKLHHPAPGAAFKIKHIYRSGLPIHRRLSTVKPALPHASHLESAPTPTGVIHLHPRFVSFSSPSMSDVPFNPADAIAQSLRAAATEIGLQSADFDPMVRTADPRFGDFQANGILPLAKKLGQPPRPLAETLLEAAQRLGLLDPNHLEWSIAGPGFINFSLKPSHLLAWLQHFASEQTLRAGAGGRLAGRIAVIDFSSPNTAKEMHVGHIRSTVIGESIARLLDFAGATVIRDNHIGDWGTQFGMLIWAIKTAGFDLANVNPETAVSHLEDLYKQGHAAYKESDATAEAIRGELVKLQTGDVENVAIWKAITAISWQAFDLIYQQLGIRFDEVLGESFYRDKLEGVFSGLEKARLSEVSDGALVVFHPEHKRFASQPFLIRKSDGASNYATTDLATVLYRVDHFKADQILYVVDSRQSDHFEQLFLTVQKWFAHENRPIPLLQHISFGSVLGENGKPIKTKEGGSIKLRRLLEEAVERAAAIVQNKNPELPREEAETVARKVGLGAIRYADLSQNRTSDYVFSWEKMLLTCSTQSPESTAFSARQMRPTTRIFLRPAPRKQRRKSLSLGK